MPDEDDVVARAGAMFAWCRAFLGGCHQAYFGTINLGADAPLVQSRSLLYDVERGRIGNVEVGHRLQP